MSRNRLPEPLVSLIIPARNAEKYIRRSLGSILDQDYRNIEIVLVDDESEDGTTGIARSLAGDRLTIVPGGGRGVSHARNIGIGEAKGDYVMFVDADDEIVQGSISEAVSLAMAENLDVVFGGLQKVWGNRRRSAFVIDSPLMVIYEGEAINSVMEATVGYASASDSRLDSCHLTGSYCKLIDAHILGSNRFDENLPIGEDTVFNVSLLKSCRRVGVTPSVWYTYHQNAGSALRSYRPKAFEEGAAMLSALHRALDGKCEPSYKRRVLFQLEGAIEQRLAPGCPEGGLFTKSEVVRRGLSETWADVMRYLPGDSERIGVKHKALLFLVRNHLYGCICLGLSVKKMIKGR